MLIDYPIKYKKFRKVLFLGGDPTTGRRIKLDPADFNEMQDIWLEQLDSFVAAIRGSESGIVDGCEVIVQVKTGGGFEVVVNPGHAYVNSTMIWVARPHSLAIPTPNWQGTKKWYFILKPTIQTFIPSVIGEPGFTELAGRPTTNRAEIRFEIELVDTLPETWYVLLAELLIDEVIVSLSSIKVVLDNRNELMLMKDIQLAVLAAKRLVEEHLEFYFDKQPMIGIVDGNNRTFTTKYPVMKDTVAKLFANDMEIEPGFYEVTTTTGWAGDEHEAVETRFVFSQAPATGTFLYASYFPEQHVQYLSQFSFAKHILPESTDHDNRYYTEAEEDIYRETHFDDPAAHPTHVLWTDFNAWEEAHTGIATKDHDNVYSRIGHIHEIDDINRLRPLLNKLSQEIGYGENDYYLVTQQINDGVDGVNKIFPVSSSLVDEGLGYVRTVYADITNDAVKNPCELRVIPSTEDFATPTVAAFSIPRLVSHRYSNYGPAVVVQTDNEVWAIWTAKESDERYTLWFSSYKPGDGYFAPATSTNLLCEEGSRVAATVVYSPDPVKNQRIAIVWDYQNKLNYAHIDAGQTLWSTASVLSGTDYAKEPAVAWIDDGQSAEGRLHVLYQKFDGETGKTAIYRRMFELDLVNYGTEERVSNNFEHHYYPIIAQDRSILRKIWMGWIAKPVNTNSIDPDNALEFRLKIVDRQTATIYNEEGILGDLNYLNKDSGIAWFPTLQGMWVQFSAFSGGMFNLYYQQFDNGGIPQGDEIWLEKGNKCGVAVTTDSGIWVVYDYLGAIYYRARSNDIGEVKWNAALRVLEFEKAPVAIPIIVGIAVPLRSLNDRVSELESEKADTEEAIAARVRAVIESMGLDLPQERINMMREKVIVETGIEVDTRNMSLGYDFYVGNKFFDWNEGTNSPVGIMPVVVKGDDVVGFANSGLVHDRMGKLTNPTGKIIKVYSTVYNTADNYCNGFLRMEARGDLECLAFRVTSTMQSNQFSPSIVWRAMPNVSLFGEVNFAGYADFVGNNDFGVEITILPGGWIYDWTIFMKKA